MHQIRNGLAKVELYGNSAKIAEYSNVPSNNIFAFTWTNAPVGTNTLVAVARDDFSLVNTSAPVSIIVTQVISMSVTVTQPVANATFVAPATIAIAATVSGNG